MNTISVAQAGNGGKGTDAVARPLKESLDYFPLDIDFDQDDKLVVPIAKYGMQGLGVIIKVMMNIYRNSYFYTWGEREQFSLSSKVNVDINLVIDIINECIKWDFFDQKVYESHKVLTSRGFQKRYIEAAKRRKSIAFREEWVLIDPSEECKKVAYSISIVNADGKLVNEYINPDKCNSMYTGNTQSKVKESKEDKELKDIPPEPPPAVPGTPPKSSSNGKKVDKYEPDNRYYKMAVYFKDNVDGMAKGEGIEHLTARSNMQKWADDFRKLVELDKHTDTRLIQDVMDWVVKDNFWCRNVLSAESFRKQFGKLVLAMRKPDRQPRPAGRSDKQSIDIVKPLEDDAGVSQAEVDELMRLAERMQAGKGGNQH
ncbi:DUF4373 domain-containing protein [Paenibacillus sp. NPDC055715]